MTCPESMKTRDYVYGVEKVNGYDAWELFAASASGDVAEVKALLKKDRRFANAQFWYQFPIHMAAREGHADIVQLLLERGADPGQSRFTYNSWDKLLRVAKERGHRKLHSLLARAMKKRFRYSPDFDVLKEAILSRSRRKVGAVLRRRPELVRASDALGNNAVHWSVITRQRELIERFAVAGAPIDAERADGQTPVLLAISGGYDYWYRDTRRRDHPAIRNTWVIAGDLLARGAWYTISVAAAAGDQERGEHLLAKDESLAMRLDSSRISPLSHAAREGYPHIVRLLLEHGADPNAPEDLAPRGRALFEACAGNHLEVAELLLGRGADPNTRVDSSGCCLTIVEVRHPGTCKPMQRLLRRHGAHTPPYAMSAREMKEALRAGHEVIRDEEFLGNVMAKNDVSLLDLYLETDRSVPHHMHLHAGITYPRSPALVRRLLARGLDPNRPDWLGRTFLHACAENLDRSGAAVFLDAGADINARDVEHKETPLAAAVRHEPPRCSKEARGKWAERQKRVVEFLLKRGAATNLPGDEPWATPLAWARRRGLAESEAILRRHGASE